jgi:hypothetical protein
VGRGEGEGEGEPLAEGEPPPPPPPPPQLALAEDVRIDESEACGWDETLVDAASDAVPLALSPTLGEGDWDRLPEPRALGEGEGDAEPQREGVPLGEGEGDAEARREAVPLEEGECDAEAQREAVPLAVADREGSPTVTEGHGEGEGELLPLPLGSGERVGAALELLDCATEDVAVCTRGLPLEDSDGGGVPSSVAVAASVGDALPHAVREGVALEECDAVPHALREGDAFGEGDALPHPLREGTAVAEGDALPHALREGDAQEVAVVDCEADGEADVEWLTELGALLEGERDAEAQREAVPLADADNEGRSPVADWQGVDECERLRAALGELVREGVAVALCDCSTDGDAVGASGLPLAMVLPLCEAAADGEPRAAAVVAAEGEALARALREGDAQEVAVVDCEADGEADVEGLLESGTLPEGERDAEAQREAVPLPDADHEGCRPVADGHGVEERERLPTTLEEVVREGTVLALCDRSTVGEAVGARVALGVSFPLLEGKVDAVAGEAEALEEGDRLLSALREGDASGDADADTEALEVSDVERDWLPLPVKDGEPLAL